MYSIFFFLQTPPFHEKYPQIGYFHNPSAEIKNIILLTVVLKIAKGNFKLGD
jgi:hypothetical protein